MDRFQLDFPYIVNPADVHIEMVNTKRLAHETPEEYVYKMVAIGRRAELPECAIAKHIINGINDIELRKHISKNYTNCNLLLQDISIYVQYNPVVKTPFVVRQKTTNQPNTSTISTDPKQQEKPIQKQIVCYNFSKPGHISVKCPEPQRRDRCNICNKTGHRQSDCPNRLPKATVNTIVNKTLSNDVTRPEAMKKNIKVNGNETIAFVDTGSNRTLIKKSFATKIGQLVDGVTVLHGFAGGKFVSDKMIYASLEIDNVNHQAELLVIDDQLIHEDVLIGNDVVCQNGSRLVIEGENCWMETVILPKCLSTSHQIRQ